MLFLDYTPELTDLELQIYKYVSDHAEKVVYMRIREVADKCHVSVASVQRFCQKFDCDGFTEFKIRLKLHFESQTNKNLFSPIDTSSYVDFFHRTTQKNFQENIKKAVDLIMKKELVLFIGVGSSNILAEYGMIYFSSLFKMSMRIEDPITNPISFLSEELLKKTCVIALSVSGETVEIIDYLSNFTFKNSSIISITNSSNSTIAKLSDVNLAYYITKETLAEQDVTSQLPALFIIEYLAKIIHSKTWQTKI